MVMPSLLELDLGELLMAVGLLSGCLLCAQGLWGDTVGAGMAENIPLESLAVISVLPQ